MSGLADDLAASPAGLGRLATGRENWSDAFALSTPGVYRSFAAPMMVLPLSVIADDAISQALGFPPGGTAAAWASALGFALYTLLYPSAVGVLAHRLGGAAGFPAFVIALNWMRFWLHVAMAALGLAAMAGLPGPVVASVWIPLAGLSLYLIWRLARETLTGEFGFSLLVVLLALAAETASNYAAFLLVRTFG